MNKKYTILIIGIIAINIFIILTVLSKGSYAYEYTKNDYTLFYKDDMLELADDISKYIGEIDDYIFPNSSFKYSNVLTQNYNFITNFAMAYILGNKELYMDKIISNSGSEYINVEEIYQITEKYFGIRDYRIIGQQFMIANNNILLRPNDGAIFQEEINNTMVYRQYDRVLADITYNSGNAYRYIFNIEDNVLKLYDVEVLA